MPTPSGVARRWSLFAVVMLAVVLAFALAAPALALEGSTGTVTGTVTYGDGQPAVNCPVNVWFYSADAGEMVTYWPALALTDENGQYSVDLSPGDYYFQFGEDTSYDSPQRWVKRFYQGADTLDNATKVTVAEGANSPVDEHVSEWGTIHGSVKNAAGAAVPGAFVVAMETQDYGYDWVGWAFTDDNGDYMLTGLTEGGYKLRFESQPDYITQYSGGASNPEDAAVVYTAIDAPVYGGDADAVLQESAKISGTVRPSGGTTPISGVGVYAWRQTDEGWTPVNDACATTDDSGNYVLGGLTTGTYRVQFSDWTGNYLDQYYNAKATIEAADDVAVVLGQTTSGINASMLKAAHITGHVSMTGTGAVPSAAFVTLFKKSDEGWDSYWPIRADENGNYDISGLTTGTYRVMVEGTDASGENTVPWPPAFAREYNSTSTVNAADLGEATNIVVSAVGQSKTVNFVVDPPSYFQGSVVETKTLTPLAGVAVEAQRYDRYALEYVSVTTTWTDENGAYRIEGLPRGSYKLYFSDGSGAHFSVWNNNVDDISKAPAISLGTTAYKTVNASMAQAGRITGSVTNDNGDPISQVDLGYWKYDPDRDEYDYVGYAQGDEGAYAVGALDDGEYHVYAQDASGFYMGEWYKDAQWESDATTVTVAGSKETSGVDFTLVEGSHISGSITNGEGAPLAGMNVQLYQLDPENGEYYSFNGVSTNDEGAYSFDGLYPGSYKVGIFDPNGTYAFQFYSGVSKLDDASVVTIADFAETRSGVDAVMHTAGTISGTVTDPQGDPVSNIEVIAADAATNGGTTLTGYTDDQGKYVIGGLATGDYTLTFVDGAETRRYAPIYYKDAYSETSATSVPVSAGYTTDNVDQQLSTGYSITGKVTRPANTSGGWVEARRTDIMGGDGPWWSYADLKSDGTYRIDALAPGSYVLNFSGVDGAASEWYDNSPSEASANLVTVGAGISTPTANATLEYGATVHGVVTDPLGDQLQQDQVRVQLWFKKGGVWTEAQSGYVWQGVQSGYSFGATDNYCLWNVLPGTYKVSFVDLGGDWQQTFYPWSTDLSNAATITVGASKTIAIPLQMMLEDDHREGTTTTIEATPAPVPYGKPVTLRGTLANDVDESLEGRLVTLWYSADNRTWKASATTARTDELGAYEMTTAPTANRYYKVVFSGDGTSLGSTSKVVPVKVYASIGTPSAPSSVRAYASFKVYGTLKPHHKSGTYGVVKLYFYRYESGKWVYRKRVSAKMSDLTVSGVLYSRYSAYTSLPRGTWQVRAYHSDSDHAASSSAYRKFSVR